MDNIIDTIGVIVGAVYSIILQVHAIPKNTPVWVSAGIGIAIIILLLSKALVNIVNALSDDKKKKK